MQQNVGRLAGGAGTRREQALNTTAGEIPSEAIGNADCAGVTTCESNTHIHPHPSGVPGSHATAHIITTCESNTPPTHTHSLSNTHTHTHTRAR